MRVRPAFALCREELIALTRICRLVEGMPLALELAASWVDTLSINDILEEIRHSLDFLQTEWRDILRRQRSVRAVFDTSWGQLGQAEQRLFASLSVFRGGFTRPAAQVVALGGRRTAISSRMLSRLVNKSFIQYDWASARYQMHELLRQYGAERLARDPVFEAAARDQHSRYYCDWLSQQAESINRAEHPPAWDLVQDDIENIRAACLWSATHGQPSSLAQAVDALGWFYYLGYANYQQGEITFRRLREALVETETWSMSAPAGAQRTMARVLAGEATMWSLLGDPEKSSRLIHESLALLDAPALAGEDTRLERAILAHQFGYNRMYADPRAGQQCFAESIELYQAIGHKLGLAYALLGLGRSATRVGALGEAREAMTRSISLHRDIGNQVGQSEALAELGGVVVARQLRFQEAEDLIRQSLSLTPETNRFGIAYGLGSLGEIQLLTGRFVEVEATILECMAIFEDLGWQVWAVRRSIVLARARLHVGEYRASRTQAERTVSLAQEVGWGRGVSYAKLVLGEVALVEPAFDQAYWTLQESRRGLQEFADEPWDVDQSAWLGLAARGLERRAEARQHLASALDWAGRHQQFMERMVALAGIALLLADEGEAEQAIELYALASRYPFVANSRWFEHVAGREIAAVAATLHPQVAAAARERGQARDLNTTMQELLAEL
jgi:tetratricopeptide (TPR) repeat protein